MSVLFLKEKYQKNFYQKIPEGARPLGDFCWEFLRVLGDKDGTTCTPSLRPPAYRPPCPRRRRCICGSSRRVRGGRSAGRPPRVPQSGRCGGPWWRGGSRPARTRPAPRRRHRSPLPAGAARRPGTDGTRRAFPAPPGAGARCPAPGRPACRAPHGASAAPRCPTLPGSRPGPSRSRRQNRSRPPRGRRAALYPRLPSCGSPAPSQSGAPASPRRSAPGWSPAPRARRSLRAFRPAESPGRTSRSRWGSPSTPPPQPQRPDCGCRRRRARASPAGPGQIPPAAGRRPSGWSGSPGRWPGPSTGAAPGRGGPPHRASGGAAG